MFEGTYTALITPFSKGQLDLTSFRHLVRAQIKGGVDGIVPAGTTGESPTLSPDEHLAIIKTAVDVADHQAQVIAGTGANSTKKAIHLTQDAEKLGADASLQVTPYYNKPSQEGLFRHFRAIACDTKLPIILYSIPGRCSIPIEVPTVLRLKKACPNIVGIKEAGGDVDRISQLRQALGPRFTILSGDDALTLPFLSVGANGVISVASNLLPGPVSRIVRLYQEGRSTEALELHQRLYPLFKDLFMETNPVPIKTAMALTGRIEPGFRLPLSPMEKTNLAQLKRTLKGLKIRVKD
ncbi:MAG: 4-hydroxy-tetrahydrodipicolinate synthase [Verrucomicrobia subdivision 3 bacterium]|nr:4-hydroxy-tetrahydrodipicolinate synthase [Limisphaerales bacterium]MCS1413026.1 4-hydroxy-tetrahydrodipicolinate synthase [Limisphaerales bacterium]